MQRHPARTLTMGRDRRFHLCSPPRAVARRLRADRPLHRPAADVEQGPDVDEHDVDHATSTNADPAPERGGTIPQCRASSAEPAGGGAGAATPAGRAGALRSLVRQLEREDRRRRPGASSRDLVGRRALRHYRPPPATGRTRRCRERRGQQRPCRRDSVEQGPAAGQWVIVTRESDDRQGRLRRSAAHRSRHLRPTRARRATDGS